MNESPRCGPKDQALVSIPYKKPERNAAVVPLPDNLPLDTEESQAQGNAIPTRAKRRFQDSYDLGPSLGEGTYGAVWKCTNKITGAILACKVIQKGSGQIASRLASQEVSALRLCQGRCPNAVQLKEALETDREVQIVTELCAGGDLLELLQQKGPLPEPAARLVFAQVATALRFCHDHGLVHLDIKPQNILLDCQPEALYSYASDAHMGPPVHVKLADFGLSIWLKCGATRGFRGTHGYAAPETYTGEWYGCSADVWSLGVVLHAMLSGELPFWSRTEDDLDELWKDMTRGELDLNGPLWEGVSEEAKELVRSMLEAEPAWRIRSFELLKHPWVLKAGPVQG